MELAEKLSSVDHTCYMELEQYLMRNGENKDEHMKIMNNLLKEQMKVDFNFNFN